MGYIKIIPNHFGLQILKNIAHKSIINTTISFKKLEAELLKSYQENLPDKKKMPEKFQHPTSDTFVVYAPMRDQVDSVGQKYNVAYRFYGKIRRKKLNKLISKYPDAYIMVDLGNGLSKKLPIKTFKKLLQIKFIIFERDYEFCMPDEHEHESMNVIWEALPDKLKDYIYSINQLIYTLTIENSYNKAIENFMLAKFFLLVGEEKTLKILYHDRTTQKMKLSDFLDKYDLNFSVDFL